MSTKSKNIISFNIPRWEELPNIDLYVDQVVNYLNDCLGDYIKDDNNDKKENQVVTKTMINNYVKQGVLEPPVKKKYNRKHIAYLFCICILKQVYSINDVNNLIKLAVKTTSTNAAYNSFCQELENAVNLTFEQKAYTSNITANDSNGDPSAKYILRNVAQTFASKFYVQKVFLKK